MLDEAPPFHLTANRDGLTAEELRLWLRDPQKIKPGTLMPNLGLAPQQIEDLIAYLYTLREQP
jgi:cytochrome c1